MESIGTAYAGLGLPAEAQPMLSEALEFARATRGHDDAGALRVQQRLADALLVSRDFAQARELLEDLVATFARTGRSAERESFDALRGLVIADMTAQDFAGAEARLRELLRACAASTACRPALAAQFRFQLAQALFLLKELDAAEAELATLFESATDATDPLCLGRAHSLSSHIAAARRDLDLAEQHARDALALFERAAAPKPTDVASALNDLCWLAGARGDFDAAVEFARRALAIDREVYGDLHASTLRHQTALAETLFSAGRVEEAEPLARGALDAWPKLGATFHADWSRSLRVMAQIYMEQGRLHEAEAAALERWERTPESAPDKAHMRDLLDQVRARIEASAESDR
jgi:tetratricopeptide (TPR) repeat protein